MDFAHEELDRTSFSRPSSILGSGDYIYIKGKKPEEIEAIQVETIEVDGLCHGVVTESTPTAAIKKGIFLEVGMPIEDPIDAWRQPVLDWINTIE